jgi:hypothetical protein
LEDPHKAAEYASEIHDNMKKEENTYLVRPSYMES